VQKSVKK
jgi:hypothetical protein